MFGVLSTFKPDYDTSNRFLRAAKLLVAKDKKGIVQNKKKWNHCSVARFSGW